MRHHSCGMELKFRRSKCKTQYELDCIDLSDDEDAHILGYGEKMRKYKETDIEYRGYTFSI